VIPGRPFPDTGAATRLPGRGGRLACRELDFPGYSRRTCRWWASLAILTALIIPELPVKAAIGVISSGPPFACPGTHADLRQLLLVARAAPIENPWEFNLIRAHHGTAASRRTVPAVSENCLPAIRLIEELVRTPARAGTGGGCAGRRFAADDPPCL
jgi:hypothetical protein